ncbi:hypothetical protein T12_8426 [Trichinella patagoniensis]|uniref:Uncharacterized protein n=1 Tax=Trichinella patagoniensis TaxID=990121 RepID=A0A0V1A8H3_9BILA|nr:hypothetical protein T12_8426 [Trichinella patagoniensis]
MSACSVIVDQRSRVGRQPGQIVTSVLCQGVRSNPQNRRTRHIPGPALSFTLIVFVERMIRQVPCSSWRTWYPIHFLCPSMGKEGADNFYALLFFLWIPFQRSQPTQRHFHVVWKKGSSAVSSIPRTVAVMERCYPQSGNA